MIRRALANDAVDASRVAEDRPGRHALLEVVVLGLSTAATERGQPLESKVEDRLRLDLRELELLLEPGARSVDVGRSADQRDHRVEIVECLEILLEDMRAGLGAAELVDRREMISRW